MNEFAIEIDGLRKAFGSVTALRGLTFRVPTGSVVGLLGPNGSGKTTTVSILSTALRPDSGHAAVHGLDVVADAAQVRAVIGFAGQFAAVDPNLTGRENLTLIGRLSRVDRRLARTRAGQLLEVFGLTDAADRLVRGYSGGMRRRLDLAAALVHRPPVLFLDEPTTGLDPESYVDFLMPGVFAQSVAFGAMGTAVGLATDLRSGLLVRFRTLPMSRIAVLAGRTLADLARNVVVVAVMLGVGYAVGFRSPAGATALLAALGLVIGFAYALCWGFMALGLRVSDPEAAQGAAVPVVFLLVFTASAFVPSADMPGWLQAFGTHQPVNALVTAERALIFGQPAAHDVLISLAWSDGLLLVFALLSLRVYTRMNR